MTKVVKLKLSTVCNKCGDKAKPKVEGEWQVFRDLDCECGGKYKLQVDKKV